MIDAALAWGLVGRGVGLVYFLSFLSIAPQITMLAGRAGLAPFGPTLARLRRDFPSSYWYHFPSVFWLIGSSDRALVGTPLLGAICAAAVVSGCASRAALCSALFLMRSLDLPIGLLYPWDSMLLEAGALTLLLPPLLPITSSLAATAAPHPWVSGALRLLLARVLTGFGKKKFVGTSLDHSCYIKHFLVAQPLPSPVGWFACRLPLPLFQFALLAMFVVECIAPIFVVPAGTSRAIAAASIGALMLGIQLGGNFGYFNVLTIVLCLGCLDTDSSVFDALPPLTSHPTEALLRLLLGSHTLLAALFFLFDSWCTTAFAYWPQLAVS